MWVKMHPENVSWPFLKLKLLPLLWLESLERTTAEVSTQCMVQLTRFEQHDGLQTATLRIVRAEVTEAPQDVLYSCHLQGCSLVGAQPEVKKRHISHRSAATVSRASHCTVQASHCIPEILDTVLATHCKSLSYFAVYLLHIFFGSHNITLPIYNYLLPNTSLLLKR